MAKNKRKCLGYVSVDSGVIVIADPAYLTPLGYEISWPDGTKDHMVYAHASYGDGVYPVDAYVNDEDRIVDLRIRFVR